LGCGNSARKAAGFIAAVLVLTVLFTSFIPTAYAQSEQSNNPHFELMMETEHFKVYFHPEDERVAADIVDVCEEVYQTLVEVYGSAPPNKTQIVIFHTYEELVSLGSIPASYTKELWETSAGGCFAYTGELRKEIGEHVEAYNSRIVTPEGFIGPKIEDFLGHEAGHRFFYYAFPHVRHPVRPNWLDEGMASYSAVKAGGLSPSYQSIVDSVKLGDPPFSGIAGLDKLQASGFGKSFNLFYEEAATIIFYLVEKYGGESFLQFLREYDQSLSLEGAVLKTFNISFNQLESEWMQSIRGTAAQAKDGSDFYNLLLYPTTTISLSGVLGKNGWYTSKLMATLSATDHISGVNKTEYSFDNAIWITYVSSFAITKEGYTTVYYKSADKVGNVETPKTKTIMVNTTLPAIKITSPSLGYKVESSTITVTWTGSDSTSGISYYEIRLDNYPLIDVGTNTTYTFSGLGDANHTIEVQVTDRAGLTNHNLLNLFYLRIVSERGEPEGKGWYAANSTATISTKTIAPMDGVIGLLGGKYVFNGWTGGITSSEPTVSVLMNGPKTVTATWKEDYTLTYVILGVVLVVALIAARAKLMRKDVLGKQGRPLEKA